MNRILCEWNPEKILGIFLRLECAFHMLDGFLANSYHIHHIFTTYSKYSAALLLNLVSFALLCFVNTYFFTL